MRGLLEQGALLVAAFGAVVVLVMGAGSLLLPEPVLDGSDGQSEAAALPSLGELEGIVAVIVVRGDVDGRYVLGDLRKSSLSSENYFTFAYWNGDVARLVITGSWNPGKPVVEDLKAFIVIEGIDFSAYDGECTGEIIEIQRIEAQARLPGYEGPRGAGTLSCENVAATRTDQIVSVEAVFRFDQVLCYFRSCG